MKSILRRSCRKYSSDELFRRGYAINRASADVIVHEDNGDLKMVVLRKGESRVERIRRVIKGSSQDADKPKKQRIDQYDDAYAAFEANELLNDPFWINQFALKKEQIAHVINSYNLIDANSLQRDFFPNWKVSDPSAALSKRAERNNVLSIMVEGERCYPIEQFDPNASTPNLSFEFSKVLEAFNANGEISQLEFLYWLCSDQVLSSPHNVVVADAINNNDPEAGWEALKNAGPSSHKIARPLDLLRHKDYQTVLGLFDDWTESNKDEVVSSHEELVNAIKTLMAVEGISATELAGT